MISKLVIELKKRGVTKKSCKKTGFSSELK